MGLVTLYSWLDRTHKLFEAIEAGKSKRADYIKRMMANVDPAELGFSDLDQLIEKVADTDPTKNGQYMTWIATALVKRPNDNRAEDLASLKRDLALFDTNKAKLENKDINQYKTFSDIYKAIVPFTKKKRKTAIDKAREDIEIVYSGPEGWIRVPKSKAAAVYLGKNTRWCTAASRSNNMYDHYSSTDDLYVIYDSATKDRLQLHIESSQLADVTNSQIGLGKVPAWARPHIIQRYARSINEPISWQKAMKMAAMAGDTELVRGNISVDTDASKILDLMKKYGV